MYPNYYGYPQPQIPQVQQPQQPQNPIIWVQGETGAKSYLVAPNQSVMLMDSEANRFYIKSSDQSGMPLPLRVFEYSERKENANITPTATFNAEGNYVTHEELNALESRILAKLKGEEHE